jgi:hypothetical protein
MSSALSACVTPAQAGTHLSGTVPVEWRWIPACAGMTSVTFKAIQPYFIRR